MRTLVGMGCEIPQLHAFQDGFSIVAGWLECVGPFFYTVTRVADSYTATRLKNGANTSRLTVLADRPGGNLKSSVCRPATPGLRETFYRTPMAITPLSPTTEGKLHLRNRVPRKLACCSLT